MNRDNPQWKRVKRALDKAGPVGITANDFLKPDVFDGLGPIHNVGERIAKLRKDGYDIVCIGERDGCGIYKYAKFVSSPARREGLTDVESSAVSEPAPEAIPADAVLDSAPVALFDDAKVRQSLERNAVNDDWDQEVAA
jgi:hypothetical protein